MLQEICRGTEGPGKVHFRVDLFPQNIMKIYQLKDHSTIHRGQSLHKQGRVSGCTFTAFSFSLPPSFCQEVKVEHFFHTEDALETELHSTEASTLSMKFVFLFFPSVKKTQLFKESNLIIQCTFTGEPKHGRGCFISSFNEGWAPFPNTFEKAQVKTCFTTTQ